MTKTKARTEDKPRLFLDLTRLGVVFGEERQRRALAEGRPDPGNKPLKPASVWTMVVRWTNPDYRRTHLRSGDSDPNAELYAANPFRPPNGPPNSAIWIPLEGETLAEVEESHRWWYRNQPGQARHTNRELHLPDAPAWLTAPQKRYRDISDVAVILGQERQRRALAEGRPDPGDKPLAAATVRSLMRRFIDPDSGYRTTHHLKTAADPYAEAYKSNPMPAPNGPPNSAIWIPQPGAPLSTVDEPMRAWYQGRPGYVGRPAKPRCPCGCGKAGMCDNELQRRVELAAR